MNTIENKEKLKFLKSQFTEKTNKINKILANFINLKKGDGTNKQYQESKNETEVQKINKLLVNITATIFILPNHLL